MSIEAIKRDLRERWGEEPSVDTCIAIIEFMSTVSAAELRMLTFTSLKNAVKKEEIDSDLLQAIAILVSSPTAALDAHAMLVDDDETEHEVPIDELNKARTTGTLVHPYTGELIPDFEKRIFPFFVASDFFEANRK